jgi:hypothetical protein
MLGLEGVGCQNSATPLTSGSTWSRPSRVASSSSAVNPIRCTGLRTHSPSRGNAHCGVANLPVNSQVNSVIEFSHPTGEPSQLLRRPRVRELSHQLLTRGEADR